MGLHETLSRISSLYRPRRRAQHSPRGYRNTAGCHHELLVVLDLGSGLGFRVNLLVVYREWRNGKETGSYYSGFGV